jgi:hypothetical protein
VLRLSIRLQQECAIFSSTAVCCFWLCCGEFLLADSQRPMQGFFRGILWYFRLFMCASRIWNDYQTRELSKLSRELQQRRKDGQRGVWTLYYGGLCVFVVWVSFGAVCTTSLTHGMILLRWLYSNKISTIANGTFAGLTALTRLYGAGLLAGWVFLGPCFWCLHGCGSLRAVFADDFEPCFII